MRLLPSFLVAAAVVSIATPVLSHDFWISNNGIRNAAGEWCCGAGDCFAIDVKDIQASPVGYKLINGEIVPYAEVQPSMDGTYWRCMRPDGSRRCFFAPPSST
jgi:hypothetical protein